MLYMEFVGSRLIPVRYKDGELTEAYKVLPESPLVDCTLREARVGERLDVSVLGVARGDAQILSPDPDLQLHAGDLLLVEGKAANIVRVARQVHFELRSGSSFADSSLTSKRVRLAEVLVMPGSWLAGHTLGEARFRERAGVTVIAVNHHGGVRRNRLSRMRLRAGDVLVVQGSREAVERLGLDEGNFVVLGDLSSRVPRTGRAGYAMGIFAGALLLGGSGVMPILTAFLLGVVCMFLVGCLTPDEGYRSVNWDMIVLVGCMIAFGEAMQRTGTATYVASAIVAGVSGFGVFWLMTVFFFLTLLLTQPMSNQASALVVLPIAIETAREIGMDPRTLVMTVTFAASCSFLTPLEPASLLVYGPGRYRFRDFVIVGSGLTLVVYAVVVLLVPFVWPP
jgi:di/tricarboxylate transporter